MDRNLRVTPDEAIFNFVEPLGFATSPSPLFGAAPRHDDQKDRLAFLTVMKHGGAVYILTNKNHTTLYVGVTSDLLVRIAEHRSKKHANSFTAKYNLEKLVYYELFHRIEATILREKQIKAGSRKKKEALIESINSNWQDLYTTLFNDS